MKENRKTLLVALIAIGVVGTSAFISTNIQASHKQAVLDSFLTENTVMNDEVYFNETDTNIEYEAQPTYTIINNGEPVLKQLNSPDIKLSKQKVADPSQRYHEVDEYLFVSSDTKMYASDKVESKELKDLEYADYVHLVGKDIYNDDGFSLIEIDGKKGYIETQKLTSTILFKPRNQYVYPYEETDVYDSAELTTKITTTPRIHGIKMIGESANVVEVEIDGKTGFIDKSKVSMSMLFDDAWSDIWTIAEIEIKEKPDSASETIKNVNKYICLQRAGVSEEWTKIQMEDGSFGYALSENLQVERPISKGEEIANFALQFVGNPYVYGGTSLTNGTDCSGFTQSVYAHFGYSINRTSDSQRSNGWAVSYEDLRPGDLVFYSGHVAMYIGDGQIVHASNSAPYPQGGIKISNVNYNTIQAIRRIVD